jgi:predicted permease
MLAVLQIVFPIYVLIGIGFAATRNGIFAEKDLQGFGNFVFYLALPALLFTAIAERPLAETVEYSYVVIYGTSTLLLMAVLYPGFRSAGYDHQTATLATMGSTCPNSGLVGYPLLLLAMPEIAGTTLAQNVLVENILFLPLMFLVIELGNRGEGTGLQVAGRIVRRVATGPLVMAMMAGVVVSALGVSLPTAIDQPLEMLAAASGAIALVVIGGNLAVLKPTGTRAIAGYIAFFKLVGHPLVILLALALTQSAGLLVLPPELRSALILSAAIPTFGSYPVIAQAYGRQGFASVVLFATTLGAFVTLSVLLLVVV